MDIERFIYRPWVGGIAVGPLGAYSVALSGGYEDDVDFGEGLCVRITCITVGTN